MAPVKAGVSRVACRPDPHLGVFETILVVDGTALELDWHLERLSASARSLYGHAFEPRLASLPAIGRGRWRMRVTVVPERDDLRVLVETEAVSLGELGLAPPSVRLDPVVAAGGIGCHKWRDRACLDRLPRGPGSEPLLLGERRQEVLETSRASVFLVEGGVLITPALDGRILPGVTRRRLLAIAGAREEHVSLERLLRADEVFLTGSIRGVEPVLGCRGRSWSEWPVARAVGRQLGACWTAAINA